MFDDGLWIYLLSLCDKLSDDLLGADKGRRLSLSPNGTDPRAWYWPARIC
jgi:hypothetical protein